MPLNNFIFDFAGTIADLSPSSAEIFREFLKENYSIDSDIKMIEKAYDCVDRNLFYSSVNVRNYEDKRDFYKYYNDMVLKNLGLFDLVDNKKNQVFEYFISVKRHWILKKDVRETFENLKKLGKTVSIVSNFDSKLKNIVANLEIEHLIDNIHISQDEGFEKPDVRFYKMFLEKYDINPKESLYVGDSYELDFEPALKVGLIPLLIDQRDRFVKREGVIKRISEVLDYL